MKKISFIISALALIFVGCSKEQKDNLLSVIDTENDVVSFKATFEGAGDPDTKLGVNVSDKKLFWDTGDAIAVQMTDNSFVNFVYNSSTKKFSATLGDKQVKDGGVAYYPATIATDGITGSVDLPTFYDIDDDATKVCSPMIATVNLGAKSLSLKHLGGILSVKVSYVPADANKLVLTVPGKTVTGTFAVTDDTDDYISAGTGSSTVTLNFTKGVFGTTATEFFFPVPVTTFSSGFTVDFKNAANETLYTHSTAKATIATARASIKRMAELTVPISIYVRNNGTDWTNFMAYYSSGTYTTSSWSTNEISDFTTTYTHNGNSYYRFTLPATETVSTTSEIIFHDSENDTVGRVDLPGLTLGGDRYYTISGDGAWRIYVCDGLSWSGGNLRAWKDGWECFTGVNGGVGPTENGTVTLMLQYYNNYTFKYWTGINSDDKFYYQFYKSDNSESTPSYGISRPGGNKDIVFNAYYKAEEGIKLDLVGTGHVVTYTQD